VLLLILLVTVLASSAFVVTHAQHDCIGLGCHTCAQISVCKLILEWIGLAALAAVVVLAALRPGVAGRRAGPAPKDAPAVRRTPLFYDRIRLNL
jgi:hypothetical protein